MTRIDMPGAMPSVGPNGARALLSILLAARTRRAEDAGSQPTSSQTEPAPASPSRSSDEHER